VPSFTVTWSSNLARTRRHFSGLPRTFWTLWVGTLVNRLGGFVVPFLSLYLTRSRGLSIERAGAIVSLYGLGLIGAGPLGGLIADRVGRRAAILLGLGAGGACAIMMGFADSIRAIAVCTFFFALLGETYRPGVTAAVADMVPVEDRPRAYGLIYWAINLGFSVAVSVAGLVVAHGYRLLSILDGVTSLFYAAIVLLAVPETRPSGAPHERGPLAGLTVPLSDRVFMGFLLVSFALVCIFWQHQVALTVDITNHGISPATYGRLIAINGIMIVSLQPFSARWLSGIDRAHILAAACVLTGVGFGINAVATTVPLFGVSVAVWTLGEIAHFPTANALISDLAPTHLRGRYMGLSGMVSGIAAVVAPLVGGLVFQSAGRVTIWSGCLVLGLCAAALQLSLGGRMRARLARGAGD